MTEESHVPQVIERVVRESRAKLIALLAARSGDIESAEDAFSEAIAAALTHWTEDGCPSNPEGWLLTTARRKRVDQSRRNRDVPSGDELERIADAVANVPAEPLPDRRLGLLFACAHPAIETGIRAPLMLQVVLGLEASQVASAFLMSPTAMAQRLVRAKAKIRDAGIPFRVPEVSELGERIEWVLDAVYAAFTQGWVDAAGTDVARCELSTEAIYLARLLTNLLPEEPEVFGLFSLLLYSQARKRARRDSAGRFVPLLLQDCDLWDWEMINEAETALRHASRFGKIGRYQIEAAIQSAYIEGLRKDALSWPSLLVCYDALVKLTGSPVAILNRTVALAKTAGPQAALAELNGLSGDPRMQSYQPYWAARAHFLHESGNLAEASHAYQVAIGLETDPAVRDYLSECLVKLDLRGWSSQAK